MNKEFIRKSFIAIEESVDDKRITKEEAVKFSIKSMLIGGLLMTEERK